MKFLLKARDSTGTPRIFHQSEKKNTRSFGTVLSSKNVIFFITAQNSI